MRRGATRFSDRTLRLLHRAASEKPRVRSDEPEMNAVTSAYAALRETEEKIDDYRRDEKVLGPDLIAARVAALVLEAQPHVEAVKAHIGQANDVQIEAWAKRQYGPLVKEVHPAIAAEAERRRAAVPAGLVPPSLAF